MDSPAATRLPHEILREIIILAYKYIPEPQEPDEFELDLHLVSPPIVASHVCRSWRYGLLDDPSLWTCVLVPQFKPSGVLEILHRSGFASLNVLLILKRHNSMKPYDYEGTPEMLFSLFQQIHRFKFLHIQIILSGYRRFSPQRSDSLHNSAQKVLSYLQQSAPKLQTFRFWYKNGSVLLKDTFPNTLFSGEAPNIKHIHYGFSEDFREIESPLFHNLSELYLTLPVAIVELGHFLSLLELSPQLKLLRVYSDRVCESMIRQPDSLRKVNLPYLERLILDANSAIELVDLILEYIPFPQDLVWHITLAHLTDAQGSPHLVELLSRTHFSSLRIQFSHHEPVFLTIEEEDCRPQYLNQFDRKTLSFMYGEADDFAILWDAGIFDIGASTRITHLNLVLETRLESIVLIEILHKLRNLETLTIRQKVKIPSYIDPPFLICLSTLLPNLENVAALEYNVNMAATEATDLDSVQDPDLTQIFIHGMDDVPFYELDSPSSASTVFLCPNLRQLTMELSGPLDKAHASVIRACSDRRREEVYPLHIFVRCPEVEKGVESILQLKGNNDIYVSIPPAE